jgi:hypothetical protein
MPVTDVRRESFMFVKCFARTTVGKIKEAFLGRDEAPSNILLCLGSGFPSETTKVGDLDHFHDKVIVFQARSVDPANTTSNTMDDMMNNTMTNTSNDTSNNTSINVTSAHSSLSSLSSPSPAVSRPQFTAELMGNGISTASPSGAPAPVRHPSVASRMSTDRSGSYPAPSAKMSSSSNQPGYATSPMTPLVNTAPVPSTPVSASPRGNAALSSAQRHSAAYNTPTRYVQAPGHTLVKNEPNPVSPHHFPYALVPHTRNPQALHDSAQYGPFNGNGHLQTDNQAVNTYPVSLYFLTSLPKVTCPWSHLHDLNLSGSAVNDSRHHRTH